MSSSSPTPDPISRERDEILRTRRAEQSRLAQLLHDTVSQSLTGTYLQAVVISQKLQKSGSEAAGDVAQLVDMLHDVVVEFGAITRQLTPEKGKASDSIKNL